MPVGRDSTAVNRMTTSIQSPCVAITARVEAISLSGPAFWLELNKIGWLSPTERASVSAHFGLPWVRPWDNRGKCYIHRWKEDSMLVKRIAANTHLQPFTSYSEILVGNCNFFLPPCI